LQDIYLLSQVKLLSQYNLPDFSRSLLFVFVMISSFCVYTTAFSQIRTSVQDGDWTDQDTWDCPCTPAPTEDAVIASGHTVTLTGATVIDDFTVESGGTLSDAGVMGGLTISGNLVLDGTFDGNKDLTLSGSGTTIDGFGTKTNMGGVTISNGNKTILSTTNITISSGDFTIENGLTVTNYGTMTIGERLVGKNAASTWVNESNSTLNAGDQVLNNGILTASATGNTVNYNSAGAQDIKISTGATYYHLSCEGDNTKLLLADIIVSGNLTIASTLDVTGNDYNINLGGNWNNSGTFLERSGTVIFDGSGAQSITNTLGEVFYNLTIDKPGGTLTLNDNVTASGINPGTFTMTRGNIDATAATLTLGDACGNEGTLSYSSGQIIGQFERWINTTSPTSFLFPVGTSSDYRPATITINVLSPCGSVIAEFVGSDPGSSGLPIRDGFASPDSVRNTFVEGYWTMTPANSLASTDYNLELEGNGFTSFTANTATRLLTRPNAGSNWDSVGTHAGAPGDTASRNNINTLPAEYAFGDSSNCNGPSTGPISGPDSVCVNDAGIGYSVTNTLGSTYTWTITGGSVASGQGLNSITVNWDGTGMVGNVRVVENNGCTDGAPVDRAVNIHTLPTSSITGRAAVGDSTTAEPYSVTANPGYTYTWTITGGAVASGQGTDSITVDWGATGSGNVRCVGSTGCGSASPVDLAVTIYASITSINSTDWDVASTWDCNCIPANSDNVIIGSGYTVTLVANTKVNNFTVNSGGTLTGGGNKMQLTGDLTVDGTYNSNNDLVLEGTSAVTLDGTGTINITGGKVMKLEGGNVNISSSANLTLSSGDLQFDNAGVSVSNNGTISFDFDIVNGMGGVVIWTNTANSTLNIGGTFDPEGTGTLTASATGNTVNYNGTGVQNIKCPASGQYHHLTASNAGTKTLVCNIDVDGNLTISGTAQLDVSSYDMSVAGNWSNTSSNADPFFERDRTVTFDGSGAQSITYASGETFSNLTVNKSGNTLTINDNVTASNALTMSGGNIDATTDTLTLGSGALDGTLTRTAGTILGRFQRYLSSTGGKLFPIGVTSDYRPATVTFNGSITVGSLISEFVASNPGTSGLYLIEDGDSIRNTFTEGYWSFTAANSFASGNYDLGLTGNGFTSYTIYGSTRILKRSNSSNPWTLNGNHLVATGSTARRTTLSDILDYEFCFGDTTPCAGPVTSAITGADSVCTGQTSVAYSVTNTPGNTYAWTITGGTLNPSPDTDNSITVDWGTTPMVGGNVSVVESDNCGNGAPVDRAVTIHTLTIDSIDGRVAVGEYSNDVVYEITNPQPGYTYTWSVLNDSGTVDFGQETDSITVDWLGPNNDTLQVIASTGCSSVDTFKLPVVIYASIHSDQTGDWSDPNTWDCSCVPAITDNVIIDSPHIVTLTSNITANNFTISTGATMDNSTFVLSLAGEYDYIVNGTHAGSDSTILAGTVTYIGGTGSITNSGVLYFEEGNKTVTTPTNLTISSSLVYINTGITVTNSGAVTIQNDLVGAAASSTWTNTGTSTLNINGVLLATGTLNANAAGNTVNYNGSTSQTVKCPSSGQYYNLTTSGSGTKSLECNIDVNGNLAISSISRLDVTGTNYSITLGGNWSNTSANADPFVQQSGTVTFDGTGAQSISNSSGETFYNFTTNKLSGTLTVNDNTTVFNTLTMTSGNTNVASGNTLTLGINTLNVGTLSRTSGTIIGNFERWINTTADPAPPVLYPVGTSGNYRPANITINTLPTNGRLTGAFIATAPGNNGVPIVDGSFTVDTTFTEGYWTLSPTSLTSTDYNLELTGDGFTSFTIVAETRILKRASGGAWDNTGWGVHVAADPATNTAKRNNLDGFGEFGFGDTTTCAGPPTSPVTGPDSVCTDSLGAPYSVTDNPPNTYTWVIIGGTQASGGSTNSITVNWGSAARDDAIVRVIETDACTSGAPVDLTVTLHTLSTSAISGDTTVQTSDVKSYTVTGRPGYTYTWSLLQGNGTLDPGRQGTDSMVITWTATGADTVRVVGSMGCGSATAVDLRVNVADVITSNGVGAGDWNVGASWAGGVAPSSNDNAVILSGDVVTTVANTTINSITIGGILSNSYIFTITDDLSISGTITGSGDIHLDGTSTAITGTGGYISNTGIVRIRNGDKSFPDTSSVTRGGTGNFSILNGITITNSGNTEIVSDMVGGGAGATWTNTANSTLTVKGDVLITGTLDATATGNTVNYNGDNTQVINQSTSYYNITVSGAGGRTNLGSNLTMAGDMIITDTLDANGYNINVAGDWTNTTGEFIPGTGTVTFNKSGTQTITNSAGESFSNLSIASGSTVQTAGAGDNINITGNWTNNGTLNAQSGKVTFNGSSAQTIGGGTPTSFNDIEVNNSSGVSLSSAQNITRTLTLTLGTFNTSGQAFTLISNASGTANIAEITGGSISGDITMQRYIAGDDDWRLLSSPVSGTDLADWNNEFAMSGFTGTEDPSMTFKSVQYYNEAALGVKETGYIVPGSTGDALTVGVGYFVWVGGGLGSPITKTIDLVAPATTGTQAIGVTYTDDPATLDDEDGWNLIGNPYPSDVLWDAVTLSNVRPFAYIWDPNGDAWVSFDQSSGRSIPSHQAFWVKADTPGSGTVTFDENDKTTDGNNFLKTSQNKTPHLHLNIDGNGFHNDTEIRFKENGTYNYDPYLDAYKMTSLNDNAPNLSTVSADYYPIDLSINSLAKLDSNFSIPVRVTWGASGAGTKTYTITADLNSMPLSSCIILKDTWNGGNSTNLRIDSSYTFTMTAGANIPARFLLQVGAPIRKKSTHNLCFGDAAGTAIATAPGTGPWNYTWVNSNGDTIKTSPTLNGPDTITGLTAGIYTVHISGSGIECSEISDTVIISEPGLFTASPIADDISCNGQNDGSIDINISGGTPPFTYVWSNGGTTEYISGLAPGSYDVIATDKNSCSYAANFTLTEPTALVATVSVTDEICIGENNGAIDLNVSGATPPYSFLWSTGQNTVNISLLSGGDYGVTVTDGINCTRVIDSIQVALAPILSASYSVSSPIIYLSNGGNIQFTSTSIGATSYLWDFGDGNTSTDVNPMHTYTAVATPTVKLTVSNGPCTEERSDVITVLDNPVGIVEATSNNPIEIIQYNEKVWINFDFEESTPVTIEVYNIIGQNILTETYVQVNNNNISLSLPGNGVYIIRIETARSTYSKKLLIMKN